MGNEQSQDKKKGKKGTQPPQPVGKYSNLGGGQGAVLESQDEDFFVIRDLDKELPKKDPGVGDLLGLGNLPDPTPAYNPNVPKPVNVPVNKIVQTPIKGQNNQTAQAPIKNPPPGQTQAPSKNATAGQAPMKTAGQPVVLQNKPNNPPIVQVNQKPVQPNQPQPTIQNAPKQPTQPAPTQPSVAPPKVQAAVNPSNPTPVAVNNVKNNQPVVNKPVESKPVAKVEPKKEIKAKEVKLFEFSKKFEPSINVPNCQYSSSPCHLNIIAANSIEAELSINAEIPNINTNISHWVLYTTLPPVTSFQTHSEVFVKFETPAETSVMNDALSSTVIVDSHGREILQIKIDATKIGSNFFGKKISLKLNYKANVYGREIFYDPNVQIPYQVATDTELYSAITSTESFSFANDHFYTFLQENTDLWRLDSEVGVDSVFFAHRVYQYIFNNFKYDETITNHQTLQQIIAERRANSYGLSLLFCTILRSQSLPARSVIGRWVINDSSIKKPLSFQTPHTLSEFFIEQVGWVPADVTSMVLFGENMPFSAQGTMPFFGCSSPNFLGVHVDYDFSLDTVYSGTKNVIDLLNPAIFVNVPNTPPPKVNSTWKLISREVLN